MLASCSSPVTLSARVTFGFRVWGFSHSDARRGGARDLYRLVMNAKRLMLPIKDKPRTLRRLSHGPPPVGCGERVWGLGFRGVGLRV